MNSDEFSNEFDILYNNITSNQGAGIDEYEKSVFLTKAQDDIIKAYFDPRLNKPQEGYDSVERRQIDFSMITVTKKYSSTRTIDDIVKPLSSDDFKPDIPEESLASDFITPIYDIRNETKAIEMESDILMIINEYVIVNRNNSEERLTVKPVQYDEYDRLMSKPYKRPVKWQAWRLINTNKSIRTAEIIVGPGDEIKEYHIRYVRKPRPIIIHDLDGLSIEGHYEIIDADNPCELDPILHPELVQRAVEMAAAVYKGDLSTQLALGTNSQTNVGMLTRSE